MARAPGLGDVGLFCAMAEHLQRPAPGPAWTYKKLAGHVQAGADGAVRRLWGAKVTAVNLRRCAKRLKRHFGHDLIAEGKGKDLALLPFGSLAYAALRPSVARLVELHGCCPPSPPLLIPVADALAAEVLPGALALYRNLTDQAPSFRFPSLDRRTLRDDVRTRCSEFGVGWQVPDHEAAGLTTEALGEPVRPALVASAAETFREPPGADELRSLIHPSRPLFVPRGDPEPFWGRAALDGLEGGAVVEVVSWQAALAHAARGDGVALVPLLPWVLRPLSPDTVVYAPAPGPEQRIVCYLPDGGEAGLDPSAAALLRAVRQNVAQLFREPARPYGAPHPEPGEARVRPARRE